MYKYYPLFAIAFLFMSCNQTDPKTGFWSISRSKELPEAVTNQAVSEGIVGGVSYIYTFGGIDSTKLYTGIHRRSYRMNTETEIWERIPDLPDTLGKIASAATRIDNIIYIIGGYHVFKDGSERSSNRIHRFDIEKNRFLEDGASVTVPIDDQVQALWRNRFIYVITGWSERANVPTIQIYDSKNNHWLKGSSVPDDNYYKSFGASGAIIGDTIYYLGGASMNEHYRIQSVLRKGVINPSSAIEINWSHQILDSVYSGYRMASFERKDRIYWIGGSDATYNYNGIAYDGGKGVIPNRRILSYNGNEFSVDFNKNIPMDLRGIANIDDSTKYLLGGMDKNQKVSRQVLRLEWSTK